MDLLRGMNSIFKALVLVGSVLMSFTAWAAPIPSFVVAPSFGQEKGHLGDLGIKGYAGTLRVQKFFPTYPIFGLGLDLKYSNLKIDHSGFEVESPRTSAAVVLPVLIPLDLFGVKLAKLPKGGGPPLYFGYIFHDEVDVNGFSESLEGTGWKAGLMLPAPGGAIQVEYSHVSFKDTDLGHRALLGTDLDSESWTVSYHLPIPLTHY